MTSQYTEQTDDEVRRELPVGDARQPDDATAVVDRQGRKIAYEKFHEIFV